LRGMAGDPGGDAARLALLAARPSAAMRRRLMAAGQRRGLAEVVARLAPAPPPAIEGHRLSLSERTALRWPNPDGIRMPANRQLVPGLVRLRQRGFCGASPDPVDRCEPLAGDRGGAALTGRPDGCRGSHQAPRRMTRRQGRRTAREGREPCSGAAGPQARVSGWDPARGARNGRGHVARSRG
jgi:hypothetical protein